jgi:hypothetical protein
VEGFARSFLLAAFRIAGSHGQAGPELIERYATGLANGTDPRHPEHWPPITDRAQPMVEAASLAIALHETRPWLWDRLDDAVRRRTADWLGGFVGATANDSNWRLFQVITEEFLASVDAPHSRAEIDAGLARLDDWYRGGGWYTDGDGRKFDYYNAWALHLYPVLWARIAGSRADPALVETHRARLREFLEVHQYFFGSDGAPVHQGRSLTYRYATAAPLWAGVLADATPLPAGRTRRLASGALKHFADRGVPDAQGLLSLGWYRPYLPVTQPYSGPASPYWASKAFLGLLLPEDHPVWTAPEEPGPVETADATLALPAPGWLLHTTAADGIVRLVNHGTDRLPPPPAASDDSPHYTRLAYSSATAPETPPGGAPGPDTHIAHAVRTLTPRPHPSSVRGRPPRGVVARSARPGRGRAFAHRHRQCRARSVGSTRAPCRGPGGYDRAGRRMGRRLRRRATNGGARPRLGPDPPAGRPDQRARGPARPTGRGSAMPRRGRSRPGPQRLRRPLGHTGADHAPSRWRPSPGDPDGPHVRPVRPPRPPHPPHGHPGHGERRRAGPDRLPRRNHGQRSLGRPGRAPGPGHRPHHMGTCGLRPAG